MDQTDAAGDRQSQASSENGVWCVADMLVSP
jgi:hypothetical protein